MKSHNVETLLLKRLLTHLQNGVIYLGLKKPVTPWIMLPNLESLNYKSTEVWRHKKWNLWNYGIC